MIAHKQEQLLLHRLRTKYRIIAEHNLVEGHSATFYRVEDPDVVLNQMVEPAHEPLHLPYWAELWDSAKAIGRFLLADDAIAAGESVLDLGCGMGLCGAVAARLGMRVLFADLEPPALLFARLNSIADAERIRTRLLDWQKDQLDERFDLIIGADILYERRDWGYLEPFWRAHLKDGGCVLLGEPGRQTGDEFIPWIQQRGWRLERFDVSVPRRDLPVRIFRLRCLEAQ